MANYKDIHGTTVRNSAGNLSGAKEGELFFDSTNLDFKYQFPAVTSTGAWRTEIQKGEIFHWDDDLCQIVVDNFKKFED